MISSKQIKSGRIFLDWSQTDLAIHSGLSVQTIQRMEQAGPGRSKLDNVQKVIAAFETAGIEFISENGGGPGVRLKK